MSCRKNRTTFYDSSALLVLSLLEGSEKTGFQLFCDAKRHSDDIFAIRESRLYPLLHELEVRGDICSREQQTADGPHRFYRLTRQGVRVLTCRRAERNARCEPIGGGACVTK